MKKYWSSFLVLFLGCLVVALQGFFGQGWILGWDNIVPEMNHQVNWLRTLNSGWYEHFGLGLASGMAHGADLVRQVAMMLADFVLPENWLRPFWIALMYVFGGVGVVFLRREVVRRQEIFGEVVSGASYLLSLITIQIFYYPFEAFVTFFGMMPWLLAIWLSFLRKRTKVSWVLLVLVNFLAGPAFYVQTLYVVYFLTLVVSALIFVRRKDVLSVILGLAFVIGVQLYWLLPTMYFSINYGTQVGTSAINEISSVETRYMNMGMGNLWDILKGRGYFLEYVEWSFEKESYDRALESWSEHSNNFLVSVILILNSIGSILGWLWLSAENKSRRYGLGIIVVYLWIWGMLSTGNGFLGIVYDAFSRLPLLGEAFRAPFTKWSNLLLIINAIGMGIFCSLLWDKLRGVVGRGIVMLLVGVLILTPAWPIWSGKMMSSAQKVEIPADYPSLFTFFQSQPKDERIAVMPLEWKWGWHVYDWGYRGSGFLWYGIEQPILDRAFDVWSPYNETFYNQLSTAFYGEDSVGVAKVLAQYDVRYVLLDESVIDPGASRKVLRFEETKQMAKTLGWKQVFAEGKLTVWEVSGDTVVQQFVSAPRSYVLAEGEVLKARVDPIYREWGTYVSRFGGDSPLMQYPLASLMRERADVSYRSDIYGNNLVTVELDIQKGTVVVPPLAMGQKMALRLEIAYRAGELLVSPLPYTFGLTELARMPSLRVSELAAEKIQVMVKEEVWEITEGEVVQKVIETTAFEELTLTVFGEEEIITSATGILTQEGVKCWEGEGGGEISSKSSEYGLLAKVRNSAVCWSKPLGNLDGLVRVSLPYKSESLARPNFCLSPGDGGEYRCLNKDVFDATRASQDWSVVSRSTEVFGQLPIWLDVTLRPSYIKTKEWEIEYQEPRVLLAPRLAKVRTEGLWNSFLSEQTVEYAGGKVELPVIPHSLNLEIEKKEPVNCDVLERGSVASEMVAGGALRYIASDRGALCDGWILPSVHSGSDMILRATGVNEQNRGVKLYLHSLGRSHTGLEALVSPKGEFDNSYSALAGGGVGEYSLTLETRSFGLGESQASQNSIKNVAVMNFPITWLSSVRTKETENVAKASTLSILEVAKTGTWLYRVKTSGEGLLRLSQGYDKGWVGYAVTSYTVSQLEHVKVDGWSNGWLVSDKEIIIFYWPQLLQYLGVIILVGTFILVFTRRRKN